MKYKSFVIISIIATIVMLFGFAGFTYYVDPLFHYHAPNPKYEYPLFSERYMNDGITRHFEYDAVITGTSMTENFKTSLFDDLFGTDSIKVPVAGARYKEVNDILERAYTYNDNIRVVMRCLDLTMLIDDKDFAEYDEYPDYLYDDKIYNDVHYLFNKDIFYEYTDYVFEFMKAGGKSTSFDAYKNWNGNYIYDANKLRKTYQRKDIVSREPYLTEEEQNLLIGNLEQNVISIAKKHPETEFYLYFPPYSILYWDDEVRTGKYNRDIEAQRLAIEMLLPYENIHLYSFFDDYIMICDLSNYIDSIHYGQKYSDQIIMNMKDKKGLLTKDNYEQYLYMLEFYELFDYDQFFLAE